MSNMTMRRHFMKAMAMLSAALTLTLTLSVAGAAAAADISTSADSGAYRVEVWALVLFGPDGRVAEQGLIDEEKYPGPFADNVKTRVQRAKIEAPMVDGRATTLRTGVRLDFEVTPTAEGGGQVRVLGLSMSALPTKRYFASYPRDVGRTGGWQGAVTGVCTVAPDGRCSAIEVRALPGMPESVRRYAKASLEGWTFAPQEVDGKPVESEFTLKLRLNTRDDKPEDFRQDKFLRLLRARERSN